MGKLVKIHEFKGVEIVEYYPHVFKNGCVVIDEYEKETIFHVQFLYESFPSYDIAVIGILCRQYLGLNHHLTYPIARMIKMDKNN